MAGIEIRNFIVTPNKVKTGENVRFQFEAVNTADVGKTKTFYLVDTYSGTKDSDVFNSWTITLVPGETEVVEFTESPVKPGEHTFYMEGQTRRLKVTKAIVGVPGFEAVFTIAGLLAIAYLLRRKG